MEPRLSLVTLQVADIGRSVAFYEALGWAPAAPPMEDVAFIQLNGIILSLYQHQARDAGVKEPHFDGAWAGMSLAYNVRSHDEVDEVLKAFEAAGGSIVKPGHDTEWGGRTSYAADPDGHLFEIAHNPAWPIDADGNITAKF